MRIISVESSTRLSTVRPFLWVKYTPTPSAPNRATTKNHEARIDGQPQRVDEEEVEQGADIDRMGNDDAVG